MPTDEGRFEVPAGYRFIGRTFAEYRRMFDLDDATLAGRTVLDCPGGPSGFTGVAAGIASGALAVDPAYGPPTRVLAADCHRAIDRTIDQLADKRHLFVWDHYDDVETRGRFLRAAAAQFLADYAQHPGRYVVGALPRLPLRADAVDLVLSGNFLFLYDDRLDGTFHRRALAELARVAAEEVRVFPLASLDRKRSALAGPVTDTLRASGMSVELRAVPYEFQPGATEMLVLHPE